MLALVLAPLIVVTRVAPPAVDCGLPRATETAQNAPIQAQKLGQLPDAEMDLAVVRSVNGCWVRQVVRFHVSDPRPQAGPGGRAPGFTGTLVPEGRVAPPAQPVR